MVVRQGDSVSAGVLTCEVPGGLAQRVGAQEGTGLAGSEVLTLCFVPLCLQPSEFEEEASRRVDDLLESYMGIRDPELGKGPG